VIRVRLPVHLRNLAQAPAEVRLEVRGPVTQRAVLDALEDRFPLLRGTIRDPATKRRRPYVRLFGCAKDLSHDGPDSALPEPVAAGEEPLLILGAMAGG
jgi:hypothetical protein